MWGGITWEYQSGFLELEIEMKNLQKPFVNQDKLKEAENFIRSKVGNFPYTAIILGSGLGYFADKIVPSFSIFSNEIPWYPEPTVEGHKGKLIFGKVDNIPILVVQGRSHYYEGKSLSEITFYVQLLAKLGIKNLVLTNAAGGINPELKPGDFVILTDYINFTQIEVFPGSKKKSPFSVSLINLAKRVALGTGIKIHQGIYCWTIGPSYETPSEIRIMYKLGADVVGMSTVPEAIMAAYLGMNVLGISLVTNLAAGITKIPLSHKEVQEVAERIKKPYSVFTKAIIREIAGNISDNK